MALSAHWQDHIEAWQASGLPQAAYCRQHGLNANTFSGWLRHYRTQENPRPPALIPVQVQPPPAEVGVIVLRLAPGQWLEFPATVSPRWLAELLQCLG
jgi:hypothetical protein